MRQRYCDMRCLTSGAVLGTSLTAGLNRFGAFSGALVDVGWKIVRRMAADLVVAKVLSFMPLTSRSRSCLFGASPR